MYLKRSSTVKYLIAACVGVLLYCEWAIYLVQPLYWPELECASYDQPCTKILFIADPQIQGDYAVPPPLNYIFNWDSDRYLKSTFDTVIKHFQPNVLVYLGDLMDEGSISTLQQFHGYVKRLSHIFDVHYSVVQVWLPGDNDIGGENEPVSKHKLAEFEKIFDQGSVISYKNITFYKVNGITHSFSKHSEVNNFKIVVSHYPITKSTAFGRQVNEEIRPNIYFCAHDHESKYVKQDSDLFHRETNYLKIGDKSLDIHFTKDTIYEIYVPTCSYRMGTSKIGYGAAVLGNNNQHMRYNVFWSPTRFPYLVIYLVLLIFLIVYFCVFCVVKFVCTGNSPNVIRGPDIIPLLDKRSLIKL